MIGFCYKTVETRGLSITSIDISLRDSRRALTWRKYYEGLHGVIFMMDANDDHRDEDTRAELHR